MFRSRKGSLSSSPSNDGTELLRLDEAGLSNVRLSSVEMQRRYHSAFAQGLATREIEADEMDELRRVGGDAVTSAQDAVSGPADVLGSRRRASISNRPTMTLASPFVITTPPAVSPLRSSTPVRGLHTTSAASAPVVPASLDIITPPSTTSRSSAFASRPPSPSLTRHRRNSTSAIPSTSAANLERAAVNARASTPPPQPNKRLKIRREKADKVGSDAKKARAELGNFGREKAVRLAHGLDSPEANVR